MFKIKKLAAVAAAAVIAVSAMAVSVSAATYSKSTWRVLTSPPELSGYVTGLVQGKDTGITFRCTDYNNPIGNDYYARGTVADGRLCLYQGDGVNLSYIGDDGTVLFQNNWYQYCNGTVQYYVGAEGYVLYSGQYVEGYSC